MSVLPFRVSGLRKRFGDLVAVDGVDLVVHPQEVVCVVGPNGAGKTTAIECSLGLQRPDAGEVEVLGLDPVRDRTRVFQHVGVQVQDNGLYGRVRVGEILRTYAQMYDAPYDVPTLIRLFGLADREREFYRKLSGGERRKLLTAIALVGDPAFAVLDEPASGLDPHARAALWDAIHRLRENGLSVLLTTHDMQEAEAHADRVYILHRGRVVAEGAPEELLRAHELETRVAVRLARGAALDRDRMGRVPGVSRTSISDREAVLFGKGPMFTSAAVEALEPAGTVTARAASLEDLYLLLTQGAYADPRGDGAPAPLHPATV